MNNTGWMLLFFFPNAKIKLNQCNKKKYICINKKNKLELGMQRESNAIKVNKIEKKKKSNFWIDSLRIKQ